MASPLKPNLTLPDLIQLRTVLEEKWTSLFDEVGKKRIPLGEGTLSALSDISEQSHDAIFDTLYDIVTYEAMRTFFGNGVLTELRGCGDEFAFDQEAWATALKRLETLGRSRVNLSLSDEGRKELEAILPTLANYAAWGYAILDQTDESYASAKACNGFLLDHTTINQDGSYTRLCRDAEQAVKQVRAAAARP